MGWELDFLHWITEIRNGVLTPVMRFFTTIGDIGIVWIVLAAVLLIRPQTRRIGFYLAVTLIVQLLMGEVMLKHIIQRERPFIQDPSLTTIIPYPLGKYSFPSGHSTASAAAFTAVFLQNKKLSIPCFFAALMIILSRLYFCVHFPTDVIAGAILGAVCAVGVYFMLERYRRTRRLPLVDKYIPK